MRSRFAGQVAVLALSVLSAACSSSSADPEVDFVSIEGQTAYNLLANRRDIVVTGNQIYLQGGFDLDGSNNDLYQPVMVINGSWNLNDYVTELRQISATDVVSMEIFQASQVGPDMRRPSGCQSPPNADGRYQPPDRVCWAAGVISIVHR